jgi:hypothetical protein
MEKSFNQQRIEDLAAWAKTVSIPGMSQAAYLAIFEYVFEEQDQAGFWNVPGNEWQVVMTGVILRGLSSLKFQSGDTWVRKVGPDGGVSIALRYLDDVLARARGNPRSVPEDIWDACQAIIARHGFGATRDSIELARQINKDWSRLYEDSCTINPIKWCSPAYLSALVDVINCYHDRFGEESNLADALDELKSLEKRTQKRGSFPAIKPRKDIDLWSTSLVLRTVSTVPDQYVDRDQVQRLAVWVMDQLETGVWKQEGAGEAAMFLARGLQGLLAARRWLDGPTRDELNKWLERGNTYLEEMSSKTSLLGNLKAYSAVVEYLAAWIIFAPVGLVFHAEKSLASVGRTNPEPREDGLRLIWLSDLHVAEVTEPIRGRANLLKRVAGKFMHVKGNPITQHFQLKNLSVILDRVKGLSPSHILVSGDVTNYAESKQFSSVRENFISVQTAIKRNTSNELDPNLWTVLPGNHDVTNEEATGGRIRGNLGKFFSTFGDAYDPRSNLNDNDQIFPIVKTLPISGGKSVRLVGVDSTRDSPVWQIGLNALGRIDEAQMNRLNAQLATRPNIAMTLVALHHHPIVIPNIVSELEDHFLSLDPGASRRLIKICAHSDVSAILHGHFHQFSTWSVLTPENRQMAIIGSPAGTVAVPPEPIEFLELREANRETSIALEHGLALYSHRHEHGVWTERFTGVFFPFR